MPTLDAIHMLLADLADPSVDQALAAALPTARGDPQRLIVQSILRRRKPHGLAGLIEHFHHLDSRPERMVLDQALDLAGLLRQAIESGQAQSQTNALQIIRAAGNLRLADLPPLALRRQGPAITAQAAAGLQELALAANDRNQHPGGRDSHAVACLAQALEQAMAAYGQHRQPAVIEALLALAPAGLSRLDVLRDPAHPATTALATMLAAPANDLTRRALLPALAATALAPAALAGLARLRDPSHLALVLSGWHFLANPAVTQALSRLSDTAGLLPDPRHLESWPTAALLGLPAWIVALPLSSARKAQALAGLSRLQPQAARLAAMHRLIELAQTAPADPAPPLALAGYAFDADPAIAYATLSALHRLRWPGLAQLLPRLLNSSHPALRRLAQEHLRPLAFERLWQAWPVLSSAQRLAAGAALIKLDPDFARKLAAPLARPGRGSRLRALAIISLLDQGPLFASALLELARDPDAKVVSAAVRALGSVDSPAARAALGAALQHADARVRANAVEALEQLQCTQHVQRLLDMARRDEGRPRANAIKALLHMRTGDALAALVRMLAEPSPRQRTSALWLVETAGLLNVARQVADLAVADPDPSVRQRADHVIHHLIDTLRDDVPGSPDAQAAAISPRPGTRAPAPGSLPGAASLATMLLHAGPALAAGRIPDRPAPPTWDAFVRDWPSHLPDAYWSLSPLGAALAAMVALFIGLLVLRRRHHQRLAQPGPLGTFRIVARRLGLPAADQRLLTRIARRQALRSPLTLLLSPDTLAQHGRRYAQTQPPHRRPGIEKHLATLAQQLFTPQTDLS